MSKLMLFLMLFLPAIASAQTFKKAIFHAREKNASDSLVLGQKIKVHWKDTSGYIVTTKGWLKLIQNDSLYLKTLSGDRKFALQAIDKIQFRQPAARRAIFFLLGLGVLLMFILTIAFFSAIGSGVPSLELLGNGLIVAMAAMVLAPLVGIFSKRRISKPAENRTLEIIYTPPKPIYKEP